MGVQLSYELVGAGWAKCRIRVDDATATATASFTEEPGEYRWVFEPLPEGKVVVRILEFREMWGGRPDEEGEVIFHAQCRLRTLAGVLLSELQKLERTYGLAGYREKWVEHDFPVGRIDELRQLFAESRDRDVT